MKSILFLSSLLLPAARAIGDSDPLFELSEEFPTDGLQFAGIRSNLRPGEVTELMIHDDFTPAQRYALMYPSLHNTE